MKKKDKKKLVDKNISELLEELKKTEKKLVESKMKLVKGQLKNLHYPAELRNKIAVIKTFIAKKEKKNE
jgi:ribosomal protein L29